ncbi:receptor-like protein EIX2 [Ziziphus jujuba]|uniref:Receptor-like protein EIX2 n=1 Tax=Ziziphus jujuba TaxID=326968 RepID=A0ABM3ISM6_ZIZJJ|nr:receptor-like protein EIX2 [Ziziphus jujuba]
MSPRTFVLFSLLLLPYFEGSFGSISGDDLEQKNWCIEEERRALLKFKEELHEDGHSLLSSWGSEEDKKECCNWLGIGCDNKTGHVVMLDLSPSTFGAKRFQWSLRGNITSSLVELRYLNYLDLSFNQFYGNHIPSFFTTFTKLTYLNLSSTYMYGEVPPQLANLSSLESLDLSFNTAFSVRNLGWISHLSSLRELVLSDTNLSKANDWLQTVNKLPHLTRLELKRCSLPNIVPSSLSLANSSKSLAVLDLSANSLSVSVYQWLFNYSFSLVQLDLFNVQLEGPIPGDFGKMTALTKLDLSYNQLEGEVPRSISNLTALVYLDLRKNQLEGEIPKSVWNICTLRELFMSDNNISGELPKLAQVPRRCSHYSLEYLDLSRNQITGSLPDLTHFSSLRSIQLSSNQLNGTVSETIGQLTQLNILSLADNSLNDEISEAHFSRLSKLRLLDLTSNPLVLNIHSDWIPPFQLDTIWLSSCKLGPRFPKWLQTQKNYSDLDISSAGISDSIPNWLWNLSTEFTNMNLSNNQISGIIANSLIEWAAYPEIDLSSNQLEGPIPLFLFEVAALHLSRNKFSSLNSICEITQHSYLSLLDVSYNLLSGELPDCWSNFKELGILSLAHNKLSGKIPPSIGSMTQVMTLHLGDNNFIGELPSSVHNCTKLIVLGVGENKLLGPIPTWIGERLQNLVILSLQSNHFYGSIPSNLCHLSHLQLLDFSVNNISGSLPKCLSNFTAMRKNGSIDTGTTIDHSYRSFNTSEGHADRFYDDQLLLVWKGTLSEYKSTLGLVRSIDLSSNKLNGEIPEEITQLLGLVSLNLSRNNLIGQVPAEIGQFASLDALDLSDNQLFGQIPSSISLLYRLSVLDLSNNNLSGKIPTSTQLQSFNPSAYMGNPQLCGAPLNNQCPGEEPVDSAPTKEAGDQDDGDGFITQGFYYSMGLGFVVGFWGVCVLLLFMKSWRYADIKVWVSQNVRRT